MVAAVVVVCLMRPAPLATLFTGVRLWKLNAFSTIVEVLFCFATDGAFPILRVHDAHLS